MPFKTHHIRKKRPPCSSESTRLSVAGLAIAVFSSAAPAGAQQVTFTDIRDAVPSKFFNPAADSTRVDPADPNTLQIGFESGRDSGDFRDDEFRASTEAFGNRVAMDTLSFNIVAPPGYYISSITYEQTGAGSIIRVADARGGSSWIVGGEPAHLGFFRSDPTLSRTVTFSDSRLTVVPVSITTSLFVFAPVTSGEATVELTSAKVVATVAPLAPSDVKKTAVIVVSGYSGTYDGNAHGATGTATGVNGEDLTGLLNLGQSFTDAPGGTANWTFAGNASYNAAEGTAAITIDRADAVIAVAGYAGTYDGAAHGATGTATGVNGENLSGLLNLGASFTDVPGGTANWTFGGTNYNAGVGRSRNHHQQGDADSYLAAAGVCHRRNGADRRAVERNGGCCRRFRIRAAARDRPDRFAAALCRLHARRYRELQRRDGNGHDYRDREHGPADRQPWTSDRQRRRRRPPAPAPDRQLGTIRLGQGSGRRVHGHRPAAGSPD